MLLSLHSATRRVSGTHEHKSGLQDDATSSLRIGLHQSLTATNIGHEPSQRSENKTEGSDPLETSMSRLRGLGLEWRADLQWMIDTFLPEMNVPTSVVVMAAVTFLVSIGWFFVYFGFIYESDRSESLLRWAHLEDFHEAVDEAEREDEEEEAHQAEAMVAAADLILCFPHPAEHHDDDELPLSVAALDRLLPAKEIQAHSGFTPRGGRSLPQLDAERKQAVERRNSATESQRLTRKFGPTRASARSSLIQDMYSWLPTLGFDVAVFTSAADSKLFVCISISRQEVTDYYLARDDVLLQVQSDVVAKLSISQPREDPHSSPPRLRFDQKLVEQLHRAGVIERGEAGEVYRMYRDAPGKPSTLMASDRFLLVHNEVSAGLNLSVAMEQGLLLDWYPVHDRQRLHLLRVTWASFDRLLDLAFVQPVHLIRDYFGARIAFDFAWNGLYCKALLALAPLGLIYELATWVTDPSPEDQHNKQLLGFSIIILIWGQVAANLWDREQAFFIQSWNLDRVEDISRAQFRGTSGPSPVDANLTAKHYPMVWLVFWRAVSGLATLGLCSMVAIFIWAFRTVIGSQQFLASSLVLTVQIKVFEFLYDSIAQVLTDLENHRHHESHYDSYIWKQFIFQSVNHYLGFFYLTMKQSQTREGCPDNNCLGMLQKQMSMSFAMLSLCRIAHVAVYTLKVKYRLSKWKERCSDASFAEEQSKYNEYRVRDQIENKVQLIISLGHVLLFGAATPVIIPLCLAEFVVQLQASAFQLTSCTQRPYPWKSRGIGAWRQVHTLLIRMGTLNTGFLLVAFGESFRNTPLLTRLTGVLLFCLVSFVVWGVTKTVVPPRCDGVTLLTRRRRHVEKAILCADSGPPEVLGSARAEHSELIRAGTWSQVPQLGDSRETDPVSPTARHPGTRSMSMSMARSSLRGLGQRDVL